MTVGEGYPMQFTIEYYRTENGREPAKEFINGMDSKMRAKAARTIVLLQGNGPHLGELYSSPLQHGIFELRIQQSNNIARILYFFVQGQRAILTHGFIKKTQKTPPAEIRRAVRSRDEFERRRLSNG